MITIAVLLLVFTVVSAIAFQMADVPNFSITGEKRKVAHVPNVKKNNLAWTLDETVVATYISLNYKMSNKDLISYISFVLDRNESAVVRKMNRIRGIGTGKSPRASKDDIAAFNALEYATPELAQKRFMRAIDTLSIQANSNSDLKSFLTNSVSIKQIPAFS